jgi:hypothetical protein
MKKQFTMLAILVIVRDICIKQYTFTTYMCRQGSEQDLSTTQYSALPELESTSIGVHDYFEQPPKVSSTNKMTPLIPLGSYLRLSGLSIKTLQ